MEGVKILSISDLLQRSRPLTGTASLKTSPCISRDNPIPPISRASSPKTRKSQPTHDISKEKTSKPLESLKSPAIIIGTVHLPTATADPTALISCDSNHSCLSFSDGSSTICCSVLDTEFNAIGKRIRVLAWNFIPFKTNGGLLEIIRWGILEATAEINRSFPLVWLPSFSLEDRQSACSYIRGILNSVSSVSAVPCTVQSRNFQINLRQSSTGGANMVGFLSEMTVCECTLCSKGVPVHGGKACHSFTKRVFVYFCGSASVWHPLLCKLLGRTVSIVGLKKKMVFVGGDESYLMFVTTEKTALYLSQLCSEAAVVPRMVISGRGELGAYTGIVTGYYFQGMAVELDGRVWLLLSDRTLALSHSFRVGALISLSNVHFIQPKFYWVKMLLLAACFKTSIDVKSFSPFETQCHLRSQTHSLLGNFIDSLNFSARFWVLLTVSCFRKKFSGIFSEKEILGSKHKEGLAQKYASSCLPICAFRPRSTGKLRGIFMEFCKHDLNSSCNEPDFGPLKLAVPMSSFISKCEAMWGTVLLEVQTDTETVGMNNRVSLLSCEGKSYRRLIRKIISSEDHGIVLVGTLKICPSSGRLQLVDATGSVDVVIPDLSSNDVDNVYEVKDYRIFLEGLPAQAGPLEVPKNESFSCKSIFSCVPCKRELNQLTIYVHFYLRNATCLNIPWCLPPCKDCRDDFKADKGGTFLLLLVTHKFPAIWNFEDDPIISDRPSSFAEAIIFPYNLFLPGENGDTQLNEYSRYKLKSHLECTDRKNCPEELSFKRLKIAPGSNGALPCSSKDNLGAVGNGLYKLPTDCFSSRVEIPCSLAVRSINEKRLLVPGILVCPNRNYNVVDKASGQKVLLEFKSESFSKYQLLQIGVYYIMKYAKEVVHGKALVTSQTPVWSLTFTSGEVIEQNEPAQDSLSEVSPVRNDEVPFGKFSSIRDDEVPFQTSPQGQPLFQRSHKQILETLSDVHLHLSVENDLFKEDTKALDGLIRSFETLGEAVSVSTCIQTMMEAPRRHFGAPDLKCRLPEGNLISLHGNVVDVHSFNHNSIDDETHSNHQISGNIHQRVQNSICIHVHEDHHMVRIRGAISTSAYPIGMGPGVHATFHRVLMIETSRRRCELMLTSVSFIVINSAKEVVHRDGDRISPPPSNSDILNEDFSDIVSSSLISQLNQCLECSNPIRLRCRVVKVLFLVMEKDERPRSRKHLAVSIPLAGFVLDDGSSSCCCWADAERAATLLGLHETAVRVSNSSHRTFKRAGCWRTENTTYHLEKMLKKHHRITVKNYGAVPDSSCLDLSCSVSSNQVLSSSDESLLKFIILNTCCGPVLSVVGDMMDSNTIGRLDKELTEMQVTVQSMQNIWAREVGYMDPLAEARNTVQQLVIRFGNGYEKVGANT
ncbi:CST complex subunit CTC1 [Magnolia sinica]|uniref:CST complex subunit CTC1 n=1 Tax=Magnolia sinica TaxID=86752 RepID=UPI0026598342|nr:CST complex subunit CTC1 [Magnolia sinica]